MPRWNTRKRVIFVWHSSESIWIPVQAPAYTTVSGIDAPRSLFISLYFGGRSLLISSRPRGGRLRRLRNLLQIMTTSSRSYSRRRSMMSLKRRLFCDARLLRSLIYLVVPGSLCDIGFCPYVHSANLCYSTKCMAHVHTQLHKHIKTKQHTCRKVNSYDAKYDFSPFPQLL
jgi:hypothetical protein